MSRRSKKIGTMTQIPAELSQAINSGAPIIVIGANYQKSRPVAMKGKPGASGRGSSINDMLGYAGKKRHFGEHSVVIEPDGPDHLLISGIEGTTKVLTREFLSTLSSEGSRLSRGNRRALDVKGEGRVSISVRFRKACKK